MAIDRVKARSNADKYIRANKIPEAIREIQKLVEDNPRDINTLNQLGNLHLRVGNKSAAVPIFIKVAELYNKNGFATKAVASLKIAVREDANNLRAWELLAELSEQQGFIKEARMAYEKVAQLISGSSELDPVIRIQRKLIDLDPDNLRAQLHLGDLLIRKGENPEGLKCYLKAGELLLSQEKIKEAARVYERALQLDPENITTLEGVIKSSLASNNVSQAETLLDNLLERSPDSADLSALKITLLAETGRTDEAEALCADLLDGRQISAGLVTKVLSFYIQCRRFEAAAQSLGRLVEGGEFEDLDTLQLCFEEVLSQVPDHLATLEGLAKLYRKTGNDSQRVNTLAKIVEVASGQNALGTAKGALVELIEVEPENQQFQEKLEMIEGRIRDEGQAPSAPVDSGVSLEPEAVDITGEEAIDVEMGDLELTEVTQGESHDNLVSLTEVEPSEAAGEEGTVQEADLEEEEEAAAADAPEPKSAVMTSMDSEMIRENLAEAEVFLKYGLVEKAVEELQGVLKKVPDHIQAHQKLIAIFKKQDKKDKAVRQVLKLAGIFREQGDEETCEQLLEEARGIDPNHKAIQEFQKPSISLEEDLRRQAAEMVSKPAPAPNVPSIDLESLTEAAPPKMEPVQAAGGADLEIELDVDVDADESAVLETELEEAASGGGPTDAMLDSQEEELEAVDEPSPVETGEEPLLQSSLDGAGEPEGAGTDSMEALSLDIAPGEVESRSEVATRIEEIQFYLNQELFGEAKRGADALTVDFPDDPRVNDLLQEVEAALSGGQPFKAPEEEIPEPAGALEEEEEDAGSSDELGSSTHFRLGSQEQAVIEGDAPSDEYYDLAAELGAALDSLDESEELFPPEEKSAEEMSFQEIFDEFKKGVESKVGEEDFSTHYNLGIAYKEMDLMDEAIGEFQIAARSPEYFMECCSMLGLCFRQKGLFDLSEKWYEKGLEAEGFPEDVYLGLKYDFAEALQEQGYPDRADELFREIYAANANYREVKDKIKTNAK